MRTTSVIKKLKMKIDFVSWTQPLFNQSQSLEFTAILNPVPYLSTLNWLCILKRANTVWNGRQHIHKRVYSMNIISPNKI